MTLSRLLRIDIVVADEQEAALDRFETLLEERELGEWEGRIDFGGSDVVIMFELVDEDALEELDPLLEELGLKGLVSVEIPKEAKADDWDDDDEDDDDDDDDLDIDDGDDDDADAWDI